MSWARSRPTTPLHRVIRGVVRQHPADGEYWVVSVAIDLSEEGHGLSLHMGWAEDDESPEWIIKRFLFDYLAADYSGKWWYIDLVRPVHPRTAPDPFVISIHRYDEAPGENQGLVDQTNQKETN